jgi:signal transduction histidine kinase/DNA-binding response OmpR family regulator/CHASE3 domain sensor protein
MASAPQETGSDLGIRGGLPLPPIPFAGFVAALLAVFLIAFLSYQSLESRNKTSAQVNASTSVLDRLQEILSTLQDAETGQRGYLLTGEEPYLTPYTSAKATLPGLLEGARTLMTDPHRAQQLDVLQQLAQAKMQELDETIELKSQNSTDKSLQAVRSDRGKVLMDRIRETIAQMRADERVLLLRSQAEWQDAVGVSVLVVWSGSALLLVLITGSAVLTSRDYRARQTQAWLRSGQMRLATKLQGEQRTDTLGENALSFLTDYLNAQVGAVYITQGHNQLQRVATFALDPAAGEELVRTGDGLLGQAAKERRVVHVREVPEDYLPISSATGRSRPRELALVPATTDGVVQAVVELGFFSALRPAQLELLERASELLGVAVRAAKDRTRLEELLAETQRQAAELQAQQEELRVSNEELEQQSNVLRESQARLETQQAELEQTNVQLEEHAQMLARQNDDLDAARGALVEKASELERSNQYKSEFLANMSHELRTPLNSSLILAKLLADNSPGNLNEEQVKFASNIYSAGNDLLELINDILDLSKIEARQIDVRRETVGLRQLVDGLTQMFVPVARQKQVRFDIEVAADCPVELETDSQRLRQILRNLLSNALKFTMEGEVLLSISTPEGTDADWLAFEIQDTGIGIAPEQQEIIFEPFRQADGTTNRRFGGTGLGLSISRELAALLGGRIELDSTPGVGSTFTLFVPRVMPAQSEQKSAMATETQARRLLRPAVRRKPAPAPRSVTRASETDRRPPPVTERLLLIIEDDAEFAATIASLATHLRFESLIASTADEGIELALRHRPMAIVLDIRLPDHTGLAVLDRLKHDPITRHIPVQVVSGFDYSETALQMGAASVLLKPVEHDQLVSALANLERRATDAQRSVLIVEDNSVQRESIEHLLKSEQVRTVAVESAARALEQLRLTSFDCMVLDLALSDASGYELLEKMANDESLSFPPVIVYTGRALTADDEQQLRRYSKSIIIKGARSPERLLDEVTLFLHRVETSLPPEQQRMLRVARSRDSVFEKRRILVVEDDVRNVFAITRVLEPHGAILEVARNGRDAIAALERNRNIDLVLMDIMMPEMDGMEAMRVIRAREEFANLPIIALTAKAMPDDRQRCLDAGANDYIIKPIDVEKLLSLLRIWMPPRKGSGL